MNSSDTLPVDVILSIGDGQELIENNRFVNLCDHCYFLAKECPMEYVANETILRKSCVNGRNIFFKEETGD